MSMRLILKLLTLAAMCIVGAQGLAEESLLHGYSRRGVNKMFLDAHAPDMPPRYSRAEVKHMIRDAKTSEDFERLADYFDYQALDYERKAQEELKELERLAAVPFHPRTYPTQFATTLELIQRYKAKAHDCSDRANGYRELTTTSGETE
jgi:hypothetical protein